MEKKIKIKDEEITIRFNLAVQMLYEDISGIPFKLEDLKFQKYIVCLYMAAIIANNENTEITLEWLANEATNEEIKAIDNATGECMTDFLHLPDIMAEKPAETEDEGEQPKN